MKLRYIVSVWVVLFVVTGLMSAQVSPQLLKSQSALLSNFSIGKDSTPRIPSRLISLELDDVPLEKALRQVADHFSLRLWYSEAVVPANKKVTASLKDASFSGAMEYLLASTELEFMVSEAGQLVLTPKERVEQETGTIVGRVLEAGTNKPLIGANVMIEGTGLGASADTEGNFRIERVPPGKYKLRATVVGYGKISKDITVIAGQVTTKDFFHDEQAVGLDEVVVTGVAFETRRREIPADISVMTSKQIEQKGAVDVIDLLKGEIPGVLVTRVGDAYLGSSITLRGSALSSGGTISERAKIYVDGIEMSSPSLLSTLDVSSIERIEVVRGPHAAALYGAQATGGVIQIITKKGAPTGLDRPKVNATVSAGYINANFLGENVTPSGLAPLETQSNLSVSGGKQTLSYRMGINYSTLGEWIQTYGKKTLNFSGGLRVVEGPVSAELTAAYATGTQQPGSARYLHEQWPQTSAAALAARYDADPNWSPTAGLDNSLTQMTLGLNVNYRATENWIHNLVLGQDNNGYMTIHRNIYSWGDTLGLKSDYGYERSTIRYNTSFRQKVGEDFSVSITGGADYSAYANTINYIHRIKINEFGDVTTASGITPFRINTMEERWTAGFNGVVEVGYADALFATVSSAAKRDLRGYKTEYLPPRYGLTYSRSFGDMQLRVRGQYGAGTVPINPSYVTASQYTYLPYDIYLDNVDLIAPSREGWDAGVEAYWGNDASISLTRFDEEGKNLIELIYVVYTPGVYPYVLQYQNTGNTVVRGWELSGKVNLGLVGLDFLTLNGNYTYSDNRITKAFVTSQTNSLLAYREGDRVRSVPTHQGGGNLTANFGKTTALLNVEFGAGSRIIDNVGYFDYLYGNGVHRDVGLTREQWIAEGGGAKTVTIDGVTSTLSSPTSFDNRTRSYMIASPLYARLSVSAEHELVSGVRAFLNVRNLLNDSKADFEDNLRITRGRVTTLGVRVNY